ncbi:hypothetical protein [Roseovarius sp. EL26]|uniref:hypothetical protein n=1 Tax=Roseovarius sp. EL26 TaxID=2126672 RepID=UPI000EA21B43|nr:hypothetical protein [Roseovarius sp. EL26]
MKRFLILLCCCFAAPLWAQTVEVKKADIERLLLEWQAGMPIREELVGLGYAGANLEVAVTHVRRINSDPVIIGYVADLVIDAYENPKDIAVQANGFILPLVDRGMGHLPTSELVYFYKVEQAILGALPLRNCGQLVTGRLSSERYSRTVAAAASKLNTPALKEYYRLQHKAARLGVTRQAKHLSDQRRDQVEAMIQQGVEQQLQGHKDAKKLTRALKDPARANTTQACVLSRLYVQEALAQTGADLRDTMIFLSMP